MKHSSTILIIDDEEDIILSLKMMLKATFQHVYGETNPNHLPRLLDQYEPDIVLLDMNFRPGVQDGKEGIQWLKKIKELRPETEVIMITAYSEVDKVVTALKSGACDFIEKPWHNEKVLATVSAVHHLVSSRKNVQKEKMHNDLLKEQISQSKMMLVGKSAIMLEVQEKIEKLAPTDASVLIRGENGTGKEIIARKIHELSLRRDKPFIMIDLGAIPDDLFESELFGYKKGAFTDAKMDKIGRLQAADGGTLFLDEIGNLSKNGQAKLLQVIQNKNIIPLGSTKSVQIDVRILAATNASLEKMIQEDTFRQDLLYRINTVEIHLPPLRQRRDDIKPLVNHFLSIYKKKYQKPDLLVTTDGYQSIATQPWPGNVRELEHAVERAVILSDNKELNTDYMIVSSNFTDGIDGNLSLDEAEKRLIVYHLKIASGNISKAAKELGITRTALYRRMKKFGL